MRGSKNPVLRLVVMYLAMRWRSDLNVPLPGSLGITLMDYEFPIPQCFFQEQCDYEQHMVSPLLEPWWMNALSSYSNPLYCGESSVV